MMMIGQKALSNTSPITIPNGIRVSTTDSPKPVR